MMSFKKSFLFIILVFSVSCWGPSKKNETILNGLAGRKYIKATFRVAEVSNSSAVPILNKGIWKIPHSLRYKFRVKVISQKDARTIIGHEFYIKKEDGTIIKEITKASGWLEWHEDVAFNFFSNNPSYLVLKREIIGRGLHQGFYPVEIAINPWAIFRSNYPSFVHLDKKDRLPVNLLSFGKEQVSKSKLGFEKSIKKHYPLDIANAKVFISQIKEYNNKLDLEVRLEMDLLAKLKDAYGEKTLYKIKSGKVRAFVSLIATNMGKSSKEHAILFHSSKPLFVKFTAQNRGIISYKGVFSHKALRGNFAIAVRLIPENVSLSTFDALYSLGSYRKLLGSSSLILEENSNEALSKLKEKFSYSEFLKLSSNIKTLKSKRYLEGIRPFRILEAIPKHQSILPGETAISRTVRFRTEFCLKHTLTDAPVVNEHFFITYESKLIKNTGFYTNREGCLPVSGTVFHKVYKPQKYFIKKFHIYHDPDHTITSKNFINIKNKYNRFNKEISFSINPWDEKITNFGFDNRYGGTKIADEKRLKSIFFLQNFSYNTLGFKYKIDEYLNLDIRKRLLLVLQPFALRYNSLSYARDEHHKSLRDGVYLMKVAFQKTYLKPAAVGITISSTQENEDGTSDRVQSIIEKIPQKNRHALQSQIKDLSRKNKIFFNLNITGINSSVFNESNLESRLLGIQDNFQSKSVKPKLTKAIEYITAYQKLIKVQNGLIIEPVALKINNPILMKIRGQLLIQLEAIDEKALQVARIFDQKVSYEAKKFFNNTINPEKSLKEIEKIKLLLRDEHKEKDLQEFVGYKQGRLSRLIRLLKKRAADLKNNSDSLDSANLPEDLKDLLKEFSFSQADIEEVEENNFMKINGKSILDPNKFLIKDSGLERRTFIAPVTLVQYDNSSYMRPTDSMLLNNCGNQECLIGAGITYRASLSVGNLLNKVEAIRASGGESKLTHEYFESENRLANIHVDDLIKQQKILHKNQEQINIKNSSFNLYTRLYGLDYISDYNVLEKNDNCFKGNNVKKNCNVKFKNQDLGQQTLDPEIKQMDFNSFKNQLNKPFSKFRKIRYKLTHLLNDLKSATVKNIKDILTTGKIKKSFMKTRLCRYMVDRLSHEQLINFDLNKYTKLSEENLKKKREELKTFSKEQLRGNSFLCDTVNWANNDIKISSFYKIYKVNSESSSYKEGQSFNVNIGTNFSLRQSFASRFDVDPSKILGIGGVPYKIGFTKSTENGFTLTSQVLLSIQESSVIFNLLSYKKCTVVRLSGVASGIVLCGKLQTAKKSLLEKYYYVSQHFTPGDQLDMGALYNHPWLIRMRGPRDILVFLNSLRKDKGSGWRSVISGFNSSENSTNVLNPFTPISNSPLDILKSIKESYASFLPGFPSHYQILD
ncbi:MAG: hypothetical protein HAW60_02155 [Bdellovibrionales bacterium]|nr:hypothetical protein [Bdellovibrionales bacterium]